MASKDGSAEVKNPTAVEFMQTVAASLDLDLETDVKLLAEKLGQSERYIYRWRGGEHGISLPKALAMLKTSGLLREPGEAAAEVAARPTVESRLAAIEAKVEDLPTAEDLRRGLESIRRTIARANQGTGAGQPGIKPAAKRNAR